MPGWWDSLELEENERPVFIRRRLDNIAPNLPCRWVLLATWAVRLKGGRTSVVW